MAYYWDNPVKHDRPLITNCYAPGLARAAGLHPKSAKQERDWDMCALNAVYGHQEGRQLSYSLNWNHDYRGYFSRPRAISAVAAFADAGLFEHRKSHQGQLGWQSNFWATPASLEVFYSLRPEVVHEQSPVVITRSRETGMIIPSKPMRRMVRLIECINEMQASIDVGLDKTGAARGPNGLWTFSSKRQRRKVGSSASRSTTASWFRPNIKYEGVAMEALAYGWEVAVPSYAHSIGITRKNLLQHGPELLEGSSPGAVGVGVREVGGWMSVVERGDTEELV
jgi:hypothetical protein